MYAQDTAHFRELHSLRSRTRALLIDVQMAFHRRNVAGAPSPSHEREEQLVHELQAELKAINAEMSSCFNPQFGGIFRTDTHPSLFSVAVRKYADIYMKDVASLANYSPNHKFYPTHAVHMVSPVRWCCHSCPAICAPICPAMSCRVRAPLLLSCHV